MNLKNTRWKYKRDACIQFKGVAMKKVIEFLRNNIKEKDSLVVACSGGPDSMCLLDLVTKLKDELNLTIIVAHVNHKLRN